MVRCMFRRSHIRRSVKVQTLKNILKKCEAAQPEDVSTGDTSGVRPEDDDDDDDNAVDAAET